MCAVVCLCVGSVAVTMLLTFPFLAYPSKSTTATACGKTNEETGEKCEGRETDGQVCAVTVANIQRIKEREAAGGKLNV